MKLPRFVVITKGNDHKRQTYLTLNIRGLLNFVCGATITLKQSAVFIPGSLILRCEHTTIPKTQLTSIRTGKCYYVQANTWTITVVLLFKLNLLQVFQLTEILDPYTIELIILLISANTAWWDLDQRSCWKTDVVIYYKIHRHRQIEQTTRNQKSDAGHAHWS